MALLDVIRQPAVGVKAEGVVPDFRVGVDGVQGRDDDGIGGEAVSAGENDVSLDDAARLERCVVQALGLLEEAVEVGETVGKLRGPFRLGGEAEVDEFLEETVLGLGVDDEAVDEPGHEGRGGGVAGAGDDDHVGENEVAREALALFVDGVEKEVNDAGCFERGLGDWHVRNARDGRFDDAVEEGVCFLSDCSQAGRVALGEQAVPLAAGGNFLVEGEHGDDAGDNWVWRRGYRSGPKSTPSANLPMVSEASLTMNW